MVLDRDQHVLYACSAMELHLASLLIPKYVMILLDQDTLGLTGQPVDKLSICPFYCRKVY